MGRSTEREAVLVRLGRLAYDAALALQRRLHALRVAGEIPDVLLTVEHDPVFTCGRRARAESFRVDAAGIEAAGIAVRRVERGGDVTYHGPGQLVVYPIFDLRAQGRDVKGHVATLEEAAIRTLAGWGLVATRRDGLPGVWTARGKIASVGVYVRRWVSMHGLALNVAVDAAHFAMIDPCGLPIRAVSIADEVAPAPSLGVVEGRFVAEYGKLLGVRWREEPATWLEGRGDV